jgi:hypothetical protein
VKPSLFPDLSELQTLFWRLLAAPEGVRVGAATLRREGTLASEDLSFLVAGDERLGPIERLDVYADMYFYRLRDCLAEDFAKLAARIDAAHWHNLVTDYLLAHAPTHYSLRELGRALPGFLETHELGRQFPALVDLARLEWARVDVFDETDAALLSRESLLEQGAAAPGTAAFALVPSARLLRLDASVLPLWKHLHEGHTGEGTALAQTRGETGGVLVWRKGFAVFHRSLPSDEESCLRALAAGDTTLAQLGELLLGAQPPHARSERAAERLATLLDLWSRDELLRDRVPA